MDGEWSLARIKVTDGQLVEHILEDVNGVLKLNFDTATSDGFISFELNINMQIYSFSVQFQGDDLRYILSSDELIMGSGDERMTYKVILLTKRDLVLEYYDVTSFQLRKFIFVKQE
tara:strand:+ start:166 stop:513 length:348 start_codon:yes stop_codon:yes gene_type:complete